MNIFTGLAAAATIAFCLPLAAQEMANAELGPPVGAVIPHDLSATDYTGAARDFASLSGEHGVALFFIRSVEWCPYCQAQAIDVNKRADEFNKRGLNVVLVSYDSSESQKTFVERRNITVDLLSDPQIEIIDAFGLRNENYEAGSKAYGVPHPTVFIVNSDKVIAAKLYEDDYLTNDKSYRKRPSVDIILEAADAVRKDGSL